MTSILSHFSDTDALLVTPHTVVAGKFAGHIDDKSMREYGQRLYQVSQQVNKERQNKNEAGKIAVLDMNAVFVNAAKTVRGGLASLLVEDGLHINEAGYKVSMWSSDSTRDYVLT
jgi:lysophospholipase L1-like esterase